MDENAEDQTVKIASKKSVSISESQIIEEATNNVISRMTKEELLDARACASAVIHEVRNLFQINNAIRGKGEKLKIPLDTIPYSIAKLISVRGDVALIGEGDKSQTKKVRYYSLKERNDLPIAYYQKEGYNKGVWELDNSIESYFSVMVEQYKPNATQKEKKECFMLLRNMLPVIPQCSVPYFVAVNNGIYDVLHKQLYDFTPELVFTSKIHTDLDVNAPNPYLSIYEDNNVIWNVEDWLKSLGSPDFVSSILEVIQAACLPLAPYNKMVLFYNTSGNAGKGTICQLIRNILGESVTTSIPLNEFSSPFGLSNLPNAMAVITDENDVNDYIKELSVIKAVITGDVVTINQKYEKPFDFRFNGLVLECINDFPNVADKSGSFKRRLHIIPFNMCFTGAEKKYIKDTLIYRDDVLKYILKKVLVDMPYRDTFTETAETIEALGQYENRTNSVIDFLDDVLPTAVWNLLPATALLYEAYKKWMIANNPSSRAIGRNDFIDSVKNYLIARTKLDNNFEWEWTDSSRTDSYIDIKNREPIVDEFRIEPFFSRVESQHNPFYYNGNYDTSQLKEKYSGLKRRAFAISQVQNNNSTTNN